MTLTPWYQQVATNPFGTQGAPGGLEAQNVMGTPNFFERLFQLSRARRRGQQGQVPGQPAQPAQPASPSQMLSGDQVATNIYNEAFWEAFPELRPPAAAGSSPPAAAGAPTGVQQTPEQAGGGGQSPVNMNGPVPTMNGVPMAVNYMGRGRAFGVSPQMIAAMRLRNMPAKNKHAY
jgi:hypothetical protein